MPSASSLNQALDHHRAGRLRQAEALYQQIVEQQPEHADALHMLGVVALQTEQPKRAVELISRSVQIAPTAASLNNLGEAYRQDRRPREAVVFYRRSIELEPRQIDAHSNLALALEESGQPGQCVEVLEPLVRRLPGRSDLLDRLGSARFAAGDPQGAIADFRRAIAMQPQFAPAHAHLGLALSQVGAAKDALASCETAVRLAPNDAEAHASLGIVLDRMGRLEDALAEFRRASELSPAASDYYGHRALTLDRLNRRDKALEVLRAGCRRCPSDPRLFNLLSELLRNDLKYADSVRAAESAIALSPNYAEAHGNRALSLLSMGDYQNGFVEYEWRWRCSALALQRREFIRPMWDGSDPTGRTILVHSEQGFGDTLQFLRYVPCLADRGATVIVECNHSVRTLVASAKGVSQVVVAGLGVPDFDLHTPLLSLPRFFTKSIETIPRQVPYLSPTPARIEHWRQQIRADKGELKVGLVWAGNAYPDAKRTVPAELLSALADIPGVRYFGIQKHNAETYQPAPAELKLVDLDEHLGNFHETAAAMMNLDLIISIDTASLHLAGALGRPTWALIPYAPDWRWLLDREVSPWYPTMRLFGQPARGDWKSVLARVREELGEVAQKGLNVA